MYFLRNCTLHLATIMVLLLVLILILVTQRPNFASKWFVIYCALTTGLACSSNSFYGVVGPSYFFLPGCVVYISNVIINMYKMLCLYFMFSWRIEFIRHITIVSCLALCFRFATGKTIKISLKTNIKIAWTLGLDIRSTHVKFSCII